MNKVLLALALLASAAPAAAESPRFGSFDLSLSGYHPSIDKEFNGRVTPYQTTFGDGRGWMFRANVAKSIFTGFGSLDAGIGAGYWERYGHGVVGGGDQAGQKASETTAMKVVPIRVSLTYRLDYFADRWGVPLAPYGRASLDRYQWWVTNGAGNTANADGRGGSGATNGYSFAGGVAFLLDFIDGGLAREMDRDTGINHTYVFAEFTKSYVSDFHSAKSWDLSDDKPTLAVGLLFVF